MNNIIFNNLPHHPTKSFNNYIEQKMSQWIPLTQSQSPVDHEFQGWAIIHQHQN